ncbi:MAG: ATP-binding protein [Pelagimonas sp.]|uniref:ATP-binding protein n=1 Tax=Pelagimonas sp. TaxID=2073170 RepID=UPI003D6A6C21
MDISPDPADYPGLLKKQKDKIVTQLVWAIALVMFPISASLFVSLYENGWNTLIFLELTMYLITWSVAFGPEILLPRTKALIVSICLFVIALIDVYQYGLITAFFPVLAVLPIVGTVLSGMRLGLIVVAIGTVSVSVIGWLTISGHLFPPVSLPAALHSPAEWAMRIFGYLIASIIGVYTTGFLYRFYNETNDELRQKFAELEKSQNRLAQSAKLAGLGYAITNLQTNKIEECDETYATMHGLSIKKIKALDVCDDIVGKIIHEDDRDTASDVGERLFRGESLIAELRHVLPNGDIRSLRKTFAPLDACDPENVRFELVCQDVTATRKMQDQLFQTQKMDAIGQMTGGVAHDFNNLLAVTLGNLELLKGETDEVEQKRMIQNCINATLRGSELTKNMLSFARRAPLVPTRVDLNDTVRNLNSWIKRTLPSTITVDMALSENVWAITVDESSFESAVLNLIVNARDAMPGGGVLRIKTENLEVSSGELKVRGEKIPSGQYVVLTVSDDGHGIDPTQLPRIFDPFFTTKGVGGGSGLGLSMLDGFMTQSGGRVGVTSDLDQGTEFRLYFKAFMPEADTMTAPQDAPLNMEGSTRILLVEDNEDVRVALVKSLSKQGFDVTEAVSGDAALEQVMELEDQVFGFDLLVTDIVMPGQLQGTDLAKALRELRPDLPVVFMSGYASEATEAGNGPLSGDIRLMKPVRRDDFLAAIARALGAAKP